MFLQQADQACTVLFCRARITGYFVETRTEHISKLYRQNTFFLLSQQVAIRTGFSSMSRLVIWYPNQREHVFSKSNVSIFRTYLQNLHTKLHGVRFQERIHDTELLTGQAMYG